MTIRVALAIFAIYALVVAFLAAADEVRARWYVAKARSIEIGAPKERVLATLGSPTLVRTPTPPEQRIPGACYLFEVTAETWSYGQVFDWRNSTSSEFPYFFPFRLRLFGLDGDDVNIVFDSKGHVAEIRLPSPE